MTRNTPRTPGYHRPEARFPQGVTVAPRAMSSEMAERQWRAGLQGLDRDVAADLAHDRQIEQLADQEALIILELGHDHFEEIIGVAGDEVAGDNFRHLHHRFLETLRL